MTVGRREFLASAAALAATLPASLRAAAAQAARTGIFPASVRADFPSGLRETYLNSAAMHPVGTAIGDENRLRLAVPVFNTHEDIDPRGSGVGWQELVAWRARRSAPS